MTAATRSFFAALLLACTYVVAGEFLQGWVGLHFDAWRDRDSYGTEQDLREWQRTGRALDLALRGWPWKTSLYRDAALWQLYGAYGGFRRGPDAGEAVLEAVDRAALRALPDGRVLLLEVRGCLMVGDYAGAEDAVARLKMQAPYAQPYWKPLSRLVSAYARRDPELQPLADDINAHFARWQQDGRDRKRAGSAHRRDAALAPQP
jgi:hypothetical protein